MGIATVAVYSDADRSALHVELADEAYRIGPAAPAESYLNADALIACAHRSGADSIHPGYGFLAESAGFARRVVAEGLVWIGPHADAIDSMGDKLRARAAMEAAGVPVVPGALDPVSGVPEARLAAERYGLPLAIKAAAGGGGHGLKVARSLEEIESAYDTARREAEAYFKNGTVYAERYLDNPKHVELQLIADKHGNVVHAGERDCSLQRRHQKLWEETPPKVSNAVRAAIREAGVRAAKAIGYDSVGTMECLVSGDAFYFLEMNTRIQVEHTVTEMVTGLDLVREQIRIAAGEPLGYAQPDLMPRGVAIEVRVNAEDPAQAFRPEPGTIVEYREPGGPGIRVDSAAYPGWTIPAEYDSLIAKLIVWAPSREAAVARLRRAIGEYVVEGVPTTLSLLRELCDYPSVIDATYGTATLEAFARNWRPSARDGFAKRAPRRPLSPNNAPRRTAPRLGSLTTGGSGAAGDTVVSPMHGIVAEVRVVRGKDVTEGQVVAVIEAMKMMNEIRAHRSGRIGAVLVSAGSNVERGTALMKIVSSDAARDDKTS